MTRFLQHHFDNAQWLGGTRGNGQIKVAFLVEKSVFCRPCHSKRRLGWHEASQAFFSCDNDRDLNTCFCMTWLLLPVYCSYTFQICRSIKIKLGQMGMRSRTNCVWFPQSLYVPCIHAHVLINPWGFFPRSSSPINFQDTHHIVQGKSWWLGPNQGTLTCFEMLSSCYRALLIRTGQILPWTHACTDGRES